MEFQKLLFDVGRALNKDEVRALAFLCTDLLACSPASLDSASELFSRLADQDHLSPERPHLLTELLLIIQRTRLVRSLGLTNQAPRGTISPYRRLLYNLSEELTDSDLKDIKFLLNKEIPRRKLEENVTTLEVFLEMEHMDLISDTDLRLLENIIGQVCPVLKEKINQYKPEQATVLHSSPVAQETGRLRSNTYPFEPNQQVSPSRERTLSTENPELQPLAESPMNSSNTSMDLPNSFHGGDACESLSLGMRSLSTEMSGLSSLKVRSDALVILPEENRTSSEMQITNTDTEDLKTYPMTAAKRGICVIVNNYDFSRSKKVLLKREGTMMDEVSLKKIFTWLGFEIETHKDCTGEKMLSVIKELSGRDHSQMDCLACFVLSHGEEGSVYGVDGHSVKITELMTPFNAVNCSSLTEKPKLFFIQACQGTSQQEPVYVESDGPARGVVWRDAIEARDSIAADADFLLGMATVPSFVSFRERSNGTWFIQSLCQNLVSMVPRNTDLVSILTKVNADVSKRTDYTGLKKQMPQPAFSLTKKVVFPIPRGPPPRL